MNRLQLIRDALAARGIDGFLVTDLRNVRYLSGFSGSSACLLVTNGEQFLFTDFRYEEQSKRETSGFEILIEKEDRPKLIVSKARSMNLGVLGFETTVTYAFYRSLLRKGIKLKAVANLIEGLRTRKDKAELKLIKQSVARAEKAFSDVKPRIKKGVTERQVALMLEEELKKNGCVSLPFDIIVAAGPGSSMPHAKPTDNRIKAGDLVVIDWGGEAGGYFSDMTRTLLIGGGNLSKKIEIYETVLQANRAAISSVREGVHARVIDGTARDVIGKAGYGERFGHGTGHGVGLEVHEGPRISRLGKETVKSGMVFTIEPGIYLPGVGGVRIEDMVIATSDGCRVLTTLPKELDIVK
jgi:Xaa-Pro aminopeptidase